MMIRSTSSRGCQALTDISALVSCAELRSFTAINTGLPAALARPRNGFEEWIVKSVTRVEAVASGDCETRYLFEDVRGYWIEAGETCFGNGHFEWSELEQAVQAVILKDNKDPHWWEWPVVLGGPGDESDLTTEISEEAKGDEEFQSWLQAEFGGTPSFRELEDEFGLPFPEETLVTDGFNSITVHYDDGSEEEFALPEAERSWDGFKVLGCDSSYAENAFLARFKQGIRHASRVEPGGSGRLSPLAVNDPPTPPLSGADAHI